MPWNLAHPKALASRYNLIRMEFPMCSKIQSSSTSTVFCNSYSSNTQHA